MSYKAEMRGGCTGQGRNLPVGGRAGGLNDRDIAGVVLLEGRRRILHRARIAGSLSL